MGMRINQAKVELHCHLDGVVDPAMLLELQEQGAELPLESAVLGRAYPVHDLDSFSAWCVAATTPLSGQWLDLYRPIVVAHMERLRAERVVYEEIFIASGELSLDPDEAVDQVAEFREWVNLQEEPRGTEETSIQVEFLVAFGRDKPLERIELIAERNIRLHQAGLIVGVALAGPEDGYPVKPLARTFARYHHAGVKVEIHAAEWCGPQSAWDALEYGSPHRIGHGTHIFQDPHLVDTILERDIHVEMCPTSNLCTGSIARIEDHPIHHALDIGMNVSVNTDDPGAFRCSMGSEHQLVADVFGLGQEDRARLGANALQSRFQPLLRGAAQAAKADFGV